MVSLPDKFHDQYQRMQQQFDEWTAFEQFYASMELAKRLQLSYRYFLSQCLAHTNNQLEHNDMFHHTIHQANAPAILACLLSDPLDKIISTLHLYLPLVSLETTNEKLLDSYRDVFVYLDSKLTNLANFSYTEQQILNFCQQIKFFIQANPCLQKFLVELPQLNALASAGVTGKQEIADEKSLGQRQHQPLQRYPSVRSYPLAPQSTVGPPPPLMNFVSEGSPTAKIPQKLSRKDAGDSGVDLSDPCLTNSVQNLLTSQNSQHVTIGRSHSANLTSPNEHENQSNHQLVIKTSSSPTPEKPSSIRPAFVPLAGVLSAPAPSHHSFYPDFRHQNGSYSHQQNRPTLTISDEDEEEAALNYFTASNIPPIPSAPADPFYADMNDMENDNKRLRQFSSLRYRNAKPNLNHAMHNSESVSQYLGVDGVFGSVRNTFIQPNSGMRDVPKWLKNLRLHKYAFFFSQMTYEQMMSLTIEQLKEGKITDGACTKILLNIKKLKERQALLQQCLKDIDAGSIDMKAVLQQLNELMLTPIRAPQAEGDGENDEDLPKLIMQVLEKVYQELTSNTSSTTILSDMCNNLVGLFDRCYKHEAFSASQRHTLLHWRGPLCNKLQTSGRIEFKSMQSSSSSVNRRTQLKPQSSMGSMNSSQVTKPAVRNIKSNFSHYPNYAGTSVPLSRQHNSELANFNGGLNSNSNDANLIRRPTKSPTFAFAANEVSHEDADGGASNRRSIVSSRSLHEHSLHGHSQAFISERSGIGSGSLRPSFSYVISTPQRTGSGYLAANQHQQLTRKTSVDPFADTHSEDKTKLCKTYSDPSRVRFYPPGTQPPQSSNHLQISAQPKSYHITSTPYSSRQYLSRSQPSPMGVNHLFEAELISQSPITKSYSDREASVFYGTDANSTDHSNTLATNPAQDLDSASKQRHNSTEFEYLCRQITESAIGDYVADEVNTHQTAATNVPTAKSSSSNSTDTE